MWNQKQGKYKLLSLPNYKIKAPRAIKSILKCSEKLQFALGDPVLINVTVYTYKSVDTRLFIPYSAGNCFID